MMMQKQLAYLLLFFSTVFLWGLGNAAHAEKLRGFYPEIEPYHTVIADDAPA